MPAPNHHVDAFTCARAKSPYRHTIEYYITWVSRATLSHTWASFGVIHRHASSWTPSQWAALDESLSYSCACSSYYQAALSLYQWDACFRYRSLARARCTMYFGTSSIMCTRWRPIHFCQRSRSLGVFASSTSLTSIYPPRLPKVLSHGKCNINNILAKRAHEK